MGKNIFTLMSITMLELCSYGQKRQLYSINIERCPRENDTPFHRNLWLTCYHDLRTGALFKAMWLIHIFKRFENETIFYQNLAQYSISIYNIGYTMIITQSNCLKTRY